MIGRIKYFYDCIVQMKIKGTTIQKRSDTTEKKIKKILIPKWL